MGRSCVLPGLTFNLRRELSSVFGLEHPKLLVQVTKGQINAPGEQSCWRKNIVHQCVVELLNRQSVFEGDFLSFATNREQMLHHAAVDKSTERANTMSRRIKNWPNDHLKASGHKAELTSTVISWQTFCSGMTLLQCRAVDTFIHFVSKKLQ